VVSVLRDPGGYQYLLQSTPVELAELSDRLVPVLERQLKGARRVFLKVDGEVPYQAAVAVLDEIRRASDQAKVNSLLRSSADGGDVKVVISLRKS
jgi:biopolymer transport protein ExbD